MSGLDRAMWRQAQHDLDVARRNLQAGDFDWVMLASQQAAEKAVKAVLPHAGLPADPTHNIKGLFGVLVSAGVAPCEAGVALRQPIQRLMVALVIARHPRPDIGEAPADVIDRGQAGQAIADAEAVIAEARRLAGDLDP